MIERGLGCDALDGLKVLELGHVVAAPFATLILSDLGADVVKVEDPEHGDKMRNAGETGRAIFATLNRDKSSVGLDLGSDRDRERLLDLVHETDVLIENFSPGTISKLNLEYDQLRTVNESLVYVRIKGFSEDGPYGDRGATDPIVQAASSLMSVTGYEDAPPVRAGTSIIDFGTAMNAVIAVLLALRRREETGEGDSVTVPLYRTGVSMMNYWLAYRQQVGRNPRRMGASHSLFVPYNVYPTADGYVFIGATSDEHWAAIKDELDLSMDYERSDNRLDNRKAIDAAIGTATANQSSESLCEALLAAGVPTGPVNDVTDVIADPHLEAVDGLTWIDTDDADDVAVPWTIPWQRAPKRSTNPPELGQHTDEIFDTKVWSNR